MKFASDKQRKAVMGKLTGSSGGKAPTRIAPRRNPPARRLRPMEDREGWRRDASEDLQAAERDLAHGSIRVAFERGYLAAEKYAKSLVEDYDPSHDVTFHLQTARKRGVSVTQDDMERAARYDSMYPQVRCLNGALHATKTDAVEVIEFAKRIRDLRGELR